jgi:hypothetical protein
VGVLASGIVAALVPTRGARATVGVDPYYSGTLTYDRTFDTSIGYLGCTTGSDRLVWDEHWVITVDPVPEANGPDTALHHGTISGTLG